MAPHPNPLVSVVTVNFNGEQYLQGLLRALRSQTYPRMEILLVDNASSDGSIPLVEREFPEVRIVRSQENLGFAGGNNLGINEARGDYVALINNDTLPHADWLRHLVETAEATDKVAAVGSKILFARPFVPVTFRVTPSLPAIAGSFDDSTDRGVLVSECSRFECSTYEKKVFAAGFHTPERLGAEVGRWTGTHATLYLPPGSLDQPGKLVLRIWGGSPGLRRHLETLIGDAVVHDCEVAPGWQEWKVLVPSEVAQKEAVDIINNAASFLNSDGTAGDRGIFEPDRGQYDSTEEVTSLCGCSMLLSKAALEQVGAFDEDFFMYFEDTELSWRLRKDGYRLLYQPKSVVRHFHASTSVEWSPLFNFLVARNRILMLLKHAPIHTAARSYLEELGRLVKLVIHHRSIRHVDVRTRLKIQASLLGKAPKACLKRLRLIARRKPAAA